MNKNRFVKQGQAYINPSKVKQLCEKWAPVLNFESASVAPITNDRTRINTAMLLENQERYCLTEGNVAGGASGVFGNGTDAFGLNHGVQMALLVLMHMHLKMLAYLRS